MDSTKLKRQIRDWLNKNVNDTATLLKVAEVIKYPIPICTNNNNVTKEGER